MERRSESREHNLSKTGKVITNPGKSGIFHENITQFKEENQ